MMRSVYAMHVLDEWNLLNGHEFVVVLFFGTHAIWLRNALMTAAIGRHENQKKLTSIEWLIG